MDHLFKFVQLSQLSDYNMAGIALVLYHVVSSIRRQPSLLSSAICVILAATSMLSDYSFNNSISLRYGIDLFWLSVASWFVLVPCYLNAKGLVSAKIYSAPRMAIVWFSQYLVLFVATFMMLTGQNLLAANLELALIFFAVGASIVLIWHWVSTRSRGVERNLPPQV